MKTKLIMVEGIPGSGKSSFAKRIADYYTASRLKTTLYNEGGFHPADLAWNAVIPVETLERVLAPYTDFRDEINKNIHIEDDYAIISYTRVKNGNINFFKDMESYEVYDNRVPFEVFDTLHRKRWHNFSLQAEQKDELTVFECAFLQNHITELMLLHLADTKTIEQHFNTLIQTVLPLSPVLVYLFQPNIRETIERAAKQRVFENGSWIDGYTHYTENTPYGKQYGLKGFDGVVQSLEKRQSMELEIIKSLPIQTIVLENTDYNWELLWENLKEKLPQ